MKTGQVNFAAGALALLCSIIWALLSGAVGAVLCIGASIAWMGVGIFQIATSDDIEPRPVSRVFKRFVYIVTDWI